MKLEIHNYVAGMTTHANPVRGSNLGGLGEHVTYVTCLVSYVAFFALFFALCPARTNGPILTIYTSYDVFPTFHARMCRLRLHSYCSVVWGTNSQKT